jgi:hypothetical protein
MTENHKTNHPDLEQLLAFSESGVAGPEAGPEAETIAWHLESCTECRLEIQSFKRFNDLGEDTEDDGEVQWDRAELELERAWSQIKAQQPNPEKRGRRRRQVIWLVPAAVAAVAALIYLSPSFSPEADFPSDVPSVVRGTEPTPAPMIILDPKSGERELPPVTFSWQTDVECDQFTLEIFTPELETVFSLASLEDTTWTITKEVVDQLDTATIYLWNVQGFREQQPVAGSGSNWFRFSRSD